MNYIPDAVCIANWAKQTNEGDARNTEALAAYLRKLLVTRFAQLGISEDEAQELAQECLIDVIQNLAKYDAAKGSISTWVSGFARTSLRSWQRKEYGRRKVEIQYDHEPEIPTTDEDLSDVECALRSTLQGLSLIDQELLYMRFSQGLSFDEIAAKTDLTTVNARKRLSRAVDRLRRDPEVRTALGI